MKFSQKCVSKKLGMVYILLGNFCLFFLIGKGPIFGPKSGLGKSLCSEVFVNKMQ